MSSNVAEQLYTEEEEMAESNVQRKLSANLIAVLEYMLWLEGYFIGGNLEILPLKDGRKYSFNNLAPDVAFFKGIALSEREQNNLKSWNMNEANRPAPTVAIEICSDSTWTVDLKQKPLYYGELGVKEYYTYDPRERVSDIGRLRGWRYLPDGTPVPMTSDGRGWLWSEELDSWLVADGPNLRLHDREGQVRLNATETEAIARFEAEQRLEAERQARLIAEQTAQAERAAKEAERKSRLAAERKLKTGQKALADLRQKMRERGIDPDSL